jgi:hypothetical protein
MVGLSRFLIIFKGIFKMKRFDANKSLLNSVRLKDKSRAAGSEKGQQIIPAIVSSVVAVSIITNS